MHSPLSFRPIFALQRGDVREVDAFGIYFAAKGRTILTPETADAVIATRSLLKPWQLACCAETIDDSQYWAMGMSSSSGEAMHVEALAAIAQHSGLDTEALICPSAHSSHSATRARQIVDAVPRQKRFHFCCGNHLVMKHACVRLGYDADNYYRQDSPIHLKLAAFVDARMSMASEWATDSCGLPTLVAPMKGVMQLWQGLGGDCGHELEAIKRLWVANAALIGGSNRVDSLITQSSAGRVLAKEGADGLLALQSLEADPANNFTIVIKLAQAASDQFILTALRCVLEKHYEALPESLHALLHVVKSAKASALAPTHFLRNLLTEAPENT